MIRTNQTLAILALIAAVGCDGIISEPGDGPGGGGPDDPPDVGGEVDGAQVGGRLLRRLTTREYDNTVRDAFDLPDSWPGSGLPPDTASELGFDNDAELLEIDAPRAQALATAAEKIARLVVDTRLSGIPACAVRDRNCAAAMVDRYGPRLFRRALTDTERGRYVQTFDSIPAEAADEALRWTLVALLNSPNFLYRFELGVAEGEGIYRLTGEELAASLAYTFTAGPPSPELLERGRRGELDTPEARLDEARRLLDTPRGRALVEDFTRRWLRYDEVRTLVKDEAVVPGFANLRDEMAEETRRFLEHVIYEQRGGVRDLFTSTVTFVTPALAQHYGLPAPAVGFGQVERPPEQALGLLAQGSILSRFALTAISSPPQRGAFIEEHLRCRPLPPPPPNVGAPPIPEPGLTTRELYETVHSVDPSCAACHDIIDGVGFGLEGFDTAGRWRTSEQGKPIDASGHIVAYDGGSAVTFTDGRGMTDLLGSSTEVGECVSGMMAAYSFGATEGHELTDPPQVDALVAGELSLFDFLAGLAATPHFSTRIER